jgi:hypothetical protein
MLCVAALVATGAVSAQDGAPVARLSVIPDGEQRLDLSTGETVLADGGTIVDAATGLELEAETIRYVEGAWIEAEEASASTGGGVLTAPALRIDLPGRTATAPQGVQYALNGLSLTAASALLRFDPDLVRFERPRADDPVLEGRALLLDVRTGDAILLGPYRFEDGPFTLRDERGEALLQLRATRTDAGVPTYRAANEVDEELWTRLAPLR